MQVIKTAVILANGISWHPNDLEKFFRHYPASAFPAG